MRTLLRASVLLGFVSASASLGPAAAQDAPSALAQAVVELHPELVEEELEKGADPNGEFRGEPLVQAALVDRGQLNEGFGPEERGLRRDRVVRALLEAGADPDRHGRRGETFLTTLALEYGPTEFVALAAAHGADPDRANRYGDSPLHFAVGWPEMRTALLEAGADANLAHLKSGTTPLMGAAAAPEAESLRQFLEAGASAEALDAQGRNAFHYLAQRHPFSERGDPEPLARELLACAERLLEAGGDPRLADATGTTPLHVSAEQPVPALLRWLLGREEAPLEAEDAEGRTPLARALQAIELENARILIAAGAATPATGLLAPMARARHEGILSAESYEAALRELGALQADSDLPDGEGWTALMWAAASDVDGAVEALLELGADPERAAPDGRRALHFAAAAGAGGVVKLLVGRGAEVEAPDAEGATAAEWALRWGHADVAEALLEAMPISRGTLRLALEAGSTATVERLLEAEPTWTSAEIEGSPPLHRAVEGRHPELVALLLERGADANAVDRSRFTPLSRAVMADFPEIAERLLAGGADPASFEKDGSALLLAAEANRSVLLETLLQSLPAELEPDGSARLLAAAVERDDLALFRFLLHHEKLRFVAGDEAFDPFDPRRANAFLAAARGPSDRYLRELVGKTSWEPASDSPALNQIWIAAVAGKNLAAVKYLREAFAVDVQKTAEERGLRPGSKGALHLSDPFSDPPPRITFPFGRAPLLIALQGRDAEMAAYLRSEGARLGPVQDLPALAVQFAGQDEARLLAHALDFLSTPDTGDPSLLMIAARSGSAACVALLLERGADPARRDRDGKSVLDYALESVDSVDSETIRLVREALP